MPRRLRALGTADDEAGGYRAVRPGGLPLVMVAVIVGVDVLVFRDQSWPRLAANVGIVLVFGAMYLRFMQRASAGLMVTVES